jgi:hypothetical protein
MMDRYYAQHPQHINIKVIKHLSYGGRGMANYPMLGFSLGHCTMVLLVEASSSDTEIQLTPHT